MDMQGHVISSIKVINIFEESAASIEKMANNMIADIYKKNKKIIDLQITGDNLVFIIGKKE